MSASRTSATRSSPTSIEIALKTTSRYGSAPIGLARPGIAHQADGKQAKAPEPLEARAVTREAMVQSALLSAARAEQIGMPKNRIILSAKVSAVQDLIAVYKELASRSDYAIHLGLTEAGMGSKGIVASAAALGILLQDGIGDTIRFRSRRSPAAIRTLEVQSRRNCCRHGFRTFGAAGRGMPRLRRPPRPVPGGWRAASGFHPRRNAGLEDAISGVEALTSR